MMDRSSDLGNLTVSNKAIDKAIASCLELQQM